MSEHADEKVLRVAGCRITEYDGAFKCWTHDRVWGAVLDPDEPCDGALEVVEAAAVRTVEDRFFARLTPKCVQVGPETTREELLAAGVTPEAADELLAYRERLRNRKREVRDD